MDKKTLVAAGFTVLLLSSVGLSGGAAFGPTAGPTRVNTGPVPLTELAPVADPLDMASAQFTAFGVNGATLARLVVTGISPSAVGMTFGAHVHIGPCLAGNGAAARAHYNIGGPPSPATEVWLDFTVLPGGVAVSRTLVPFVIPSGAARSVVIHALPTDPSGAAGIRLACLPVDF